MRNLIKNKRGAFELEQLQTVIVSLVVIGILLGVGILLMSEFYKESCESWNATSGECDTLGHASSGINETRAAIGDIPGWLSLIVLVVVIGIILAIVFRVMPGSRGGGVPGMAGGY